MIDDKIILMDRISNDLDSVDGIFTQLYSDWCNGVQPLTFTGWKVVKGEFRSVNQDFMAREMNFVYHYLHVSMAKNRVPFDVKFFYCCLIPHPDWVDIVRDFEIFFFITQVFIKSDDRKIGSQGRCFRMDRRIISLGFTTDFHDLNFLLKVTSYCITC